MPELPDDDQPDPTTTPAQTPPGRARLPTTNSSGGDLPQVEETTPGFRESVFGMLTGRRAQGTATGDVRSQLVAAFGSSSRDPARPDTAAAAKALGVTQRSVQRWVKNGGGLSKRHTQTVQRRARQAMTTRRGRQRALAASQRAGTATRPTGKKGRGITVGGTQGVTSSVMDNYRDRDTTVQVTEEDLAQLQQTWVEHGEAGAAAWLHQHWDSHYVGGWHFQSIEDVTWGDSRNY